MLRILPIVLALLLFPATASAEGDLPAGAAPAVDVGLDPGHSWADVGAVGGGLREYEVTLDLATRVRELLVESGTSVALSRQDDNPLTDFSAEDPSEAIRVEQEARIAAVGNARIYVSIHLNGYGDPGIRGEEIYYNGENNGDASVALAQAIHDHLLEDVRAAGYNLPDRGVKEDLSAGKPYGHFFSLRGEMPSVLVESMFLTNSDEASQLRSDAIREAVARGIAEGILEYLGQGTGDGG